MPKKVLILKNITREGPGLLSDLLEEQGIGNDIVDLELGENLPPIVNYMALVVLGGPDSANDQTPKILKELAYIKAALSKGVPYLGICLGLQLLVKATGGQVVRNHVSEIGFCDPEGEQFTVELTAEGKDDPLFKGLHSPFSVFQLHGETVNLTDQMTLLGTGQHCVNQVVKVGKSAYGIQCHFELSPELFDLWCAEDADLKAMDNHQLHKSFVAMQSEYTAIGKQLMRNFLGLC